jgi:pimeloyl-ACP methyl ester carboxylesterase
MMINAAPRPYSYRYLGRSAAVSARQGLGANVVRITRRLLLATGIAGLGLGGIVATGFSAAMRGARARLDAYGSRIVETRHGPLEYAEAGNGPPLLMIHGSGGGFDQGLLFADPLVKAGRRVIAPSRFGYLRSAFPDDPSSDNQADAFADLLDALKIERVAVAGGSAGALSALAFAIRHPQRCAALVAIVPAAYAPNRPPARPWGPWETQLAERALQSDFLFWSAIEVMPDTMIRTILATDPSLLVDASPAERRRVEAILQAILPVSQRSRGLLNDMRLAGNPERQPIERIAAPTLAVSFDDDLYLTADAARFIAATVPDARLLLYPTGGHVAVGRNADMYAAIDSFIEGTGHK